MKRIKAFSLLMVSLALFVTAHLAFAQSYSFSLDEETVNVYIEDDGTMRIDYSFVFTNDMSAPPIEFIDVGMHNEYYDLSKIRATINGQTISHIAPSEYEDNAFELGLGSYAIRPGSTGQVDVTIWGVTHVLYIDSQDTEYASVKFSPTWFDASAVHGTTDLSVTFHLPPGVQPDEPKWHTPEGGWPSKEPYADFDVDGRIVYVWWNASANGYTQYIFGASFPKTYVPSESILTPSLREQTGIPDEVWIPLLVCGGGVLLFIAFIALGVRGAQRRKLAYLPPKIAIEGHGIKRGLTAVEAAVLLETPLDRVLTMILFSLIKKNGARVVSEDPLKIERMEQEKPLRPYEKAFLAAMIDVDSRKRSRELQKLMIDLVKSVQKKMKGFSLRETRDYYQSIMRKAWQQVEEAETPEVRSKRFDEGLEWTMLDRDFDDRTERTFRTGPVFVPSWWWLYRPSYRPATSGPSVPRPSSVPSGRGVTLPRLPGSEFAASIVNGVQNTAKGLVSNVVNFTNGVTKTTNPPPPPSRSRGGWTSGGGGGCACACACACAGCACACAGGGR